MKKGYFLFLLLVFAIVPIKVSAYGEYNNPGIVCDNNVSVDQESNCRVIISNTGDEAMKVDTLSVSGTSGIILSTPSKTTEFIQPGSENAAIATFTAKSSTAGTYRITLTSLNMVTASDVTGASGSTGNASTTIKILSNDARLSNLTVDGTTVNNFNSDRIGYSATVTHSTATIGATAIAGASMTGTGTVNLVCGKNTAIVNTKSEDNKNTKTYTITITRECNTDTTLAGVGLSSGTISPRFSGSNSNYTVSVDSNVTRISITPKKNNDTQTVTSVYDKALNYGDNRFNIVVTSESGETRTYSFTVNRPDDRSDDATLKNIELSAGKISFDANTTEYDFKVLYDVDKIVITPTTNNEKATFEVSGGDSLVVGENIVTIKVKAENETEKVYTIKVTRLNEGEDLGDDPSIKTLSISDYILDFSSDSYNYNLKIKNEKELDLKIVMNQESAKYSVVGNSNLKDGSVIIIKTTSEDGSSLTYKITIQKSSNLWIWIIVIIIILLIALGIVLFLLKKNKKNTKEVKEKDTTEKTSKEKDENSEEEKDVEKTKVVKTTVIADKDLLKKVENQIKKAETDTDERKSETVEKEPIVDLTKSALDKDLNKAEKIETLTNEDLEGLGEAKKESIIKPISIIDLKEKDVDTKEEKIENIDSKKMNYRSERFAESEEPEENHYETKICSICGHKVPKDAKVCPYCRRVWK